MKDSYFSDDIKEFIKLLDKYAVKYVIVGGEAVIYYGYPRLTGDVDFFYSASSENVQQLYEALKDFWDGNIPGIKSENELSKPGYIIQFGVPPNRIDLMNTIDGVTFKEAWPSKKKEAINIEGKIYPVYFLGLEQLIQNKKASGRDKDLDDLTYLTKSSS